MAEITDHLPIEQLLQNRSKATGSDRYRRYHNLKRELLDNEYLFTMHRFPGGNDHGPDHIKRVLEYLDRLLGDSSQKLTEGELFLLLCAVLLHDQGMLHGRAGHSRVSQRLLKLPQYTANFDEPEQRYIGKFTAVHSASQKIEEEFKGFKIRESAGGQSVRPLYLAALLRFADELDEDYRRAKKRIFEKILLPEESVIYWLINLSIEGVEPVPSDAEIRVTVHYEPDELGELFPFGADRKVNVLAAVFRKMQKLNSERQYCMRFMEDGVLYKRVVLRIRSDRNEPIVINLDDADDGETLFKQHSGLFREQVIAKTQFPVDSGVPVAPDVSNEPRKKRRTVRNDKQGAVAATPFIDAASMDVGTLRRRDWGDLTTQERDQITFRKKEFVNDALEITGHPELYGRWSMAVQGLPQDGQVSLEIELFPHFGTLEPVLVQIFAVGTYPLKPPEIGVAIGSTEAGCADLAEQLSGLCPALIWQERYRSLKAGRLIHLVDAITSFQNHAALFKHHARILGTDLGSTWRLLDDIQDMPRLVRQYKRPDQVFEVSVEPTRSYPLRAPVVRCNPVPPTSAWLGSGELNWASASGTADRWNQILAGPNPNPLASLSGLLELLLGPPTRG